MLNEQITLVTGASRGIGAAIADGLGQAGAVVIGTATSQKGADAIAARFAEKGIKGGGMVLDVEECSARRGFARVDSARIVEVTRAMFAIEGSRLATCTGIEVRDAAKDLVRLNSTEIHEHLGGAGLVPPRRRGAT